MQYKNNTRAWNSPKAYRVEKIKLVGEYIYKNINVVESEIDKCKLVGHTFYGTLVEVFEETLDTDLLIATGNIEYHYFAGYSGGAKAVMPGISSRNSIQANHSMMLENKASAGRFYDNPLRCDIEESGKLVGIDFIFNVLLDDDKNIIAAVAGKNNEAFIEGVKIYDSIYKIEVREKADIVITSPGGYLKDINLYQSQKALDNVKEVVTDNGIIILVAKCPEGFGGHTFKEWMSNCSNYPLLHKRIKENFVLGGHKAVAISKIISKNEVFLYSDFDKDITEYMGFKKLDNLQDYIYRVVDRENNIKMTVVPCGRFIKIGA